MSEKTHELRRKYEGKNSKERNIEEKKNEPKLKKKNDGENEKKV